MQEIEKILEEIRKAFEENTEDITTYNKQILTISNKAEQTEEPESPIDTTIGTVIVRYLDKETNAELLPTETMKQRIGTRYATNGKEVQYYTLIIHWMEYH